MNRQQAEDQVIRDVLTAMLENTVGASPQEGRLDLDLTVTCLYDLLREVVRASGDRPPNDRILQAMRALDLIYVDPADYVTEVQTQAAPAGAERAGC